MRFAVFVVRCCLLIAVVVLLLLVVCCLLAVCCLRCVLCRCVLSVVYRSPFAVGCWLFFGVRCCLLSSGVLCDVCYLFLFRVVCSVLFAVCC